MTVPDLHHRIVCGCFYWTFQFFMQKRAICVIASRTNKIKLNWPLSTVRTVVLLALLYYLQFSTGGQSVSTTDGLKKNRDILDSFHHHVSVIRFSLLLLDIMQRLRKTRSPYSTYTCISFNTAAMFRAVSLSTVVVSIIFIVGLLLASGDVESNPGPGTDRYIPGNDRTEFTYPHNDHLGQFSQYGQYHQLPFDRLHADITSILHQAVERIERTGHQQTKSIENRLKSVEEKIDIRLQQIERCQEKLCDGFEELQSQCKMLWRDNDRLQSTISFLSSQCEQFDKQKRQNNLVFSGLDLSRGRFETWEECEVKIRDVIRKGIGIEEHIQVEWVRRAGRNIIVHLLSYKQKMMILLKARDLKNSTEYRNVFIRDDFTDSVQQMRQGLFQTQRQLRQEGQTAWLRYDKLLTRDAVYTFDLNDRTVKRQSRQQSYRDFRGHRNQQDSMENDRIHPSQQPNASFPPAGNRQHQFHGENAARVYSSEEENIESTIEEQNVSTSASKNRTQHQDTIVTSAENGNPLDTQGAGIYNLRSQDRTNLNTANQPADDSSPRRSRRIRASQVQRQDSSSSINTCRKGSSSQQRIDQMMRPLDTSLQPADGKDNQSSQTTARPTGDVQGLHEQYDQNIAVEETSGSDSWS